MVHWVKDLARLQLWYMSLLWLRFDPWPRKCALGAAEKEREEKKKKKKKGCSARSCGQLQRTEDLPIGF